jgi:MFS family permease
MSASISQAAAPASKKVLSLALAAVCLGYFMVILDTTIVNVALPALRVDLGASVSGLQWVVDGYLLMFASLLLTGGVLADRLGAGGSSRSGWACSWQRPSAAAWPRALWFW